jgi:carboxymethylenebutenolidase
MRIDGFLKCDQPSRGSTSVYNARTAAGVQWLLDHSGVINMTSAGQKLFLAVAALAAFTAASLMIAQDGGGTPKKDGKKKAATAGLAGKSPELPANLFVAASTVARTPLRHEWIDILSGKSRLHTWVEYPAGEAKAPVVILMHYDAGLDVSQRAVADQLALDGFIAVAPDLLSGRGASGGNFDAFRFPDEALRANLKIPTAIALRKYKAAYDYAAQMPRFSGKAAVLGCGLGGTLAWRFAAAEQGVSAAVVFYGLPPADDLLAKITAPVLGLYGGDDDPVDATIEPTAAAMKKLGKSYESHVYPGATHAFLTYQAEGLNGAATAEAWPAAIAFLREHT